MEQHQQLKAKLVDAMREQVLGKMAVVHTAMADADEGIKSDTKSSAGDKFETGREMMQLELNNKQAQLSELKKMLATLNLVDASAVSGNVQFGSLVVTNAGIYFFSVPLGKLVVDGQTVYALSPVSPIGKLIIGKKAGDYIELNGKLIQLLSIY